MRIELDDIEIEIAKAVAAEKQRVSKEKKLSETALFEEKKSHDQVCFEGYMAELAWAKWRNTYPLFTDEVRSGLPDAYWLKHTIEIKSIDSPNKNLIIPKWQGDKKDSEKTLPDFYVLALLEAKAVIFIGYIASKYVIKKERISNVGYGPCYLYARQNLNRFNEDLFDKSLDDLYWIDESEMDELWVKEMGEFL